MNAGFDRNPQGELCADGVPLSQIAEKFGTPCYVYSSALLGRSIAAWREALSGWPAEQTQLCYSVKANSNLSVLRRLADAGWGFDIVSGGELARLMHLQAPAGHIRFSGVGKTGDELRQAVQCGIGAIHLESAGEAEMLARIAAEEGRSADAPVPVSLRVNPGIRAGGADEISTAFQGAKFGLSIAAWQRFLPRLAELSQLRLTGLACHLGSQIDSAAPYVRAADSLVSWAKSLKLPTVTDMDLGGGAAVGGESTQALELATLASAVVPKVTAAGYRCVFSPGRSVVAEAGILLMRTLYLKTADESAGSRTHAIVDAAMNDYIRPALYRVKPVLELVSPAGPSQTGPSQAGSAQEAGSPERCDISGPICESTDTFRHDFSPLPAPGSLLALRNAGAYGMSMASSYNSRPRCCEVMVAAGQSHLVRRREKWAELFAHEPLEDRG